MHIPDGFLSTGVSLILWAISVVVIGIALRRVGRELGERQVPLMGVLAAAIFAGQMLNFAVAGGTSGHLLGATLATILLGPWPAIVVMTSVVSIQAIVFQDGGLLALGSNLFNMALVGVAVSHFSWSSIRSLTGRTKAGFYGGAAVSAWLSIVIAAIACALEIAVSGTSPANLAVPAMAGIHALIGVGEAVITAGAVAFLLAARPDLLQSGNMTANRSRAVWIGGALMTLVLVAAAPLASKYPDGLERVAQKQGFWASAQNPIQGLIPNYVLPGIRDHAMATVLAVAVGSVLVLITTLVVARSGRRKRSG
ncbi:MAG TPA: energy-coupling factor ABC transporter permease [Anaerolineales bacterium]|nr:energy-coupling factor ABC transporter permease [Anaerolineales bacterium]